MIKTQNCTQCDKEFSFNTRSNRSNRRFCGRTCVGISRRVTDPLHVVKTFHDKVTKTDGCWTWNSTKDQDGYGILGFNKKTLKAHRVSWQMHKGKIPNGLSVLHICDNPECTNPEHLFLGTARDNLLDMIKKGRRVAARGEKASGSKLKNNEVYEIRALLKEGYSFGQLSKKFNIDRGVIRDIKHRKTWSHLI